MKKTTLEKIRDDYKGVVKQLEETRLELRKAQKRALQADACVAYIRELFADYFNHPEMAQGEFEAIFLTLKVRRAAWLREIKELTDKLKARELDMNKANPEFEKALDQAFEGFQETRLAEFPMKDAFKAAVRGLFHGRIAPLTPQEPIPMILNCPVCHKRHIDVGEFIKKPHHTHACQHCGVCWRPAVVPTRGVQFLPGFQDERAERVHVPSGREAFTQNPPIQNTPIPVDEFEKVKIPHG